MCVNVFICISDVMKTRSDVEVHIFMFSPGLRSKKKKRKEKVGSVKSF